jgi:hypothetical protein
VDLDGTLAIHDKHGSDFTPLYIGEPIAPMVERVKAWLAQGITVKIFTARVNPTLYTKDGNMDIVSYSEVVGAIKAWCLKHLGYELEVTCAKDPNMTHLWDDRCVQVEFNKGTPCLAIQPSS